MPRHVASVVAVPGQALNLGEGENGGKTDGQGCVGGRKRASLPCVSHRRRQLAPLLIRDAKKMATERGVCWRGRSSHQIACHRGSVLRTSNYRVRTSPPSATCPSTIASSMPRHSFCVATAVFVVPSSFPTLLPGEHQQTCSNRSRYLSPSLPLSLSPANKCAAQYAEVYSAEWEQKRRQTTVTRLSAGCWLSTPTLCPGPWLCVCIYPQKLHIV